jgi:hypothetical protein
MARLKGQNTLNLDDLILNCLERHAFLSFRQIVTKMSSVAQESGGAPWVDATIRTHLDRLCEDGKVRPQEAGFLIDQGWREEQPKAFILVEVDQPKQAGKINQEELVDKIRDSFRRGECKGLNLIGVDEVMGAEFSLIIQVYSDHLHYIGKFVKEHLLTTDLVTHTRTIVVWPRESGKSKSEHPK